MNTETERDPTVEWLTVAILTMQNPPSWDEAHRIAEHLISERILATSTHPQGEQG